MNDKELNTISGFLDKLRQVAPCKGGACVGFQNCEFGEYGCYGESCAIEDVQRAMYVECKE